jgi:ketosteroid isomerase-like protein
MLDEKVEALRAGLDAFNRRDKAAWLALIDREAENLPPKDWPEQAPIRGAEAIWDFYVDAITAWDDAEFGWGEFVDVPPDTVVANQRAELRGMTSGAGVIWSYWVVWTFREGKGVRIEWFADRHEALRAAGSSE